MLSSELEEATLNMLYDSDAYVVVHIDANHDPDSRKKRKARDGFEIVDKQTNMEVYLDGDWADVFHAHIKRWQEATPHQEEVEEVLAEFCALAQIPLVSH